MKLHERLPRIEMVFTDSLADISLNIGGLTKIGCVKKRNRFYSNV